MANATMFANELAGIPGDRVTALSGFASASMGPNWTCRHWFGRAELGFRWRDWKAA
jgi:hypothetical protein